MKKVELYKKSFFNNVVIVTGAYCAGKSMVSPIVSSLKKIEHVRKLITVDQILHLSRINKIKKNVAGFLIRHFLDKNFYEQLIGRNTNFRLGDETSIFTAKNTLEMISRSFIKRGEHVIKKHVNDKTIFCMDTHDGILLHKYWEEVNKNFKFINIFRNPIDSAVSWHKWGKGNHDKILFNEVVMLKKNNFSFPHYFAHNVKNYQKLSPMDRIIEMIIFSQKGEYRNYKKNLKNKKYLFLEYQDFAENTENNIYKICKFLKTNKSKLTKKIMKRERFPRIISNSIYKENLKKVKFLSSSKYFKKILDLEKIFIKRKKETLE